MYWSRNEMCTLNLIYDQTRFDLPILLSHSKSETYDKLYVWCFLSMSYHCFAYIFSHICIISQFCDSLSSIFLILTWLTFRAWCFKRSKAEAWTWICEIWGVYILSIMLNLIPSKLVDCCCVSCTSTLLHLVKHASKDVLTSWKE